MGEAAGGGWVKIIMFDTETTGLLLPEGAPLENQPQIIEFAAIAMDNTSKKLIG